MSWGETWDYFVLQGEDQEIFFHMVPLGGFIISMSAYYDCNISKLIAFNLQN